MALQGEILNNTQNAKVFGEALGALYLVIEHAGSYISEKKYIIRSMSRVETPIR